MWRPGLAVLFSASSLLFDSVPRAGWVLPLGASVAGAIGLASIEKMPAGVFQHVKVRGGQGTTSLALRQLQRCRNDNSVLQVRDWKRQVLLMFA
jgi:hypothetical protein